MAKQEKYSFDKENLPFMNTDLLFHILAHQKAIVTMQTNTEKQYTKEEANELIAQFRKEIIEEMFAQYGSTPNSNK